MSVEGRLPQNILFFCRTLRSAGVPLGPAQVVDALRAVAQVGVRNRDDFRTALRTTLLKDPAHFRLFDQAFHLCFRNPRLLERALSVIPGNPARLAMEQESVLRRLSEAMTATPASDERQRDEPGEARAQTFSATEYLRDRDFEEMSVAEQRAAARILKAELDPLAGIVSRRFRQHALGDRADLRRSMRQMLRNNGELITLARQRRRLRPPPVVLICDVSGSMSAYSRMFLLFAHVLSQGKSPAHTFVFGTRLTNITRRLHEPDADLALAAVAREVRDWDGGTRIADSLRQFNLDWGRRVLAQNAIVILLSDGLERDTESDLEFQIGRLHRSCRQLIWLNPMLRYAEFQPRAFGIRVMLPHVDRFMPAHNLRTLGDLGRLLGAALPAGSAA